PIGSSAVQGAVADTVIPVRAAGVRAGRYALAAQLRDSAGNEAWLYGRTITITPPDPFATLEGGILTFSGTEGGDGMSLRREGATLLAQLNGAVEAFEAAGIERINVLAGGGDDMLIVDASVFTPLYVDGGSGNDHLIAGSGNDTMTGGAGRNTLLGQAGDDRINGSGGRDVAFGGDGADRLYGNGGDDALDGGGGVDRLWGGDGDDLLIGGGGNDKLFGDAGQDTLLGRAGADLLDGGAGTDSSDDDSADERISIELLP
ncbi:MAG: hypothetical protein RMJ35_11055, partial [Phycisphaerales bacterium]|nr:hypothetical protein [Phycisphaerales bacterium]